MSDGQIVKRCKAIPNGLPQNLREACGYYIIGKNHNDLLGLVFAVIYSDE